MVCDNDLADCTCPNLRQRLDEIKACPHIHIGAEYLARIEQQADKPIETRQE